MKRPVLTLILATISCVGLVTFFATARSSADDLNTTQQSVQSASYAWKDMADVDVSTGDGQTLTFHDGNGIRDYVDNATGKFFGGNCTVGGDVGQSTILANSGNLSASGQPTVQWKYLPPASQSCVDWPTDGSFAHITIYTSDISSTGNSTIEYTYDNSKNQIDLVDGSATPYTVKSSSFPNVYVQGGGTCVPEIVINSTGGATLWPLGPGGQGVTDPLTDAKGCTINNNIISYEDDAATKANKQNANGSVPIQVAGIQFVSSNSDGTVTCADGSTAANAAACVSGAAGTKNGPPTCESSGISLAWIVCPIEEDIAAGEQKLESVVTELLKTQPIAFNAKPCNPSSSTCNPNSNLSSTVYSIWSNFRLYGNIVLVLALLAIVIAEVVGGGIIDAYTIKRMLPRVLVAVILINLSIYIVAILEDITNVVGSGIGDILTAPFKATGNYNFHLSGGTGDVAFTLGLGAVLAVGFVNGVAGILLLVLGTVVLAAIGVLLTLMFRQGLLVVLVLTSPVAFALYAFPNGEALFRRWWDLLFKTLLVYPIVTIVFAIADITGIITGNLLGTTSNANENMIYQLMGLLAVVAPLFLIPFAFRLAGGAIGSAHQAISGVTKRLSEPLANARKANRADRAERARNNNLFRGDSAMAKRMSAISQGVMLANKAGLRPDKMRERFRSAKSARTTMLSAKAGESVAASALTGNDDILTAALHGNGTEDDARAYLHNLGQRGEELEQNVSSISQAKREMGREAFEDFAAANLAGTGTGYASGPGEMLETINRVAGTDRARAARILNSARSQAERARRVDLYGSGFATSADQMAQLAAGKTNRTAVNEVMTDEALKTKSAGEIATSRNNALTNMAGAVQRRTANANDGIAAAQSSLASAKAGGNPNSILTAQQTLDEAVHNRKRIIASTANLLDVAGQSAEENSEIIGGLLGQYTGNQTHDHYVTQQARDLNGNLAVDSTTNMPVMERVGSVELRPETIGDQIESLRSDPEFQQYRREYGSDRAAAAAGGLPGMPGGPGGPGTPGAPGTPGPGPTGSDRRLKTDIYHLQTLENGIKLYRFKYVWGGPVYVGVMAQDLLATYPQAVGIDNSGYYYVNYGLLGLRMITLEEWQATQQTIASLASV